VIGLSKTMWSGQAKCASPGGYFAAGRDRNESEGAAGERSVAAGRNECGAGHPIVALDGQNSREAEAGGANLRLYTCPEKLSQTTIEGNWIKCEPAGHGTSMCTDSEHAVRSTPFYKLPMECVV
jgi:hypothetical protein